MSSEQTTRNLFKVMGNSPYMLPLLNYVGSSSPRYSEIEDYFRTVRKLYGYSHGLPTSKVIASNLRTLTRYDLIEKRGGRWKLTSKGSMIVDFEKKLEPQEQTIYLWIAGQADLSPETPERIVRIMARHDFNHINSLDHDRVMAVDALIRMNAGYNEIVTMDDREVLCGITYPLDEARLATASRNPLISKESEKYPTMMDFLYAHMASRLTHPVADLEHAFSGELRWENEVGVANGKTKTLSIWLADRQEFQKLGAYSTNFCKRLALVRSVGDAIEELNKQNSIDKATRILSRELIDLETSLLQYEFGDGENSEAQIRALQMRRSVLIDAKTESFRSLEYVRQKSARLN
jgi:hypothetical protein